MHALDMMRRMARQKLAGGGRLAPAQMGAAMGQGAPVTQPADADPNMGAPAPTMAPMSMAGGAPQAPAGPPMAPSQGQPMGQPMGRRSHRFRQRMMQNA